MRTPLIAGNWKMHKNLKETEAFAVEIKGAYKKKDVDVVICAPFTDLYTLTKTFEDGSVAVGAQNVHYEPQGAYTGEISVGMIEEIGVKYCIVGHSERREYFGETDESINKKIHALLEKNIKPILCVGERLDEREAGRERQVIKGQLISALEGISYEDMKKIVIAYEPVWAIGTGKTATARQAEEICAFIRETVGETFNTNIAEEVIIQYGGSVKGDNIAEIMSMPNIDGALVGGASLKVESFMEIVNF